MSTYLLLPASTCSPPAYWPASTSSPPVCCQPVPVHHLSASRKSLLIIGLLPANTCLFQPATYLLLPASYPAVAHCLLPFTPALTLYSAPLRWDQQALMPLTPHSRATCSLYQWVKGVKKTFLVMSCSPNRYMKVCILCSASQTKKMSNTASFSQHQKCFLFFEFEFVAFWLGDLALTRIGMLYSSPFTYIKYSGFYFRRILICQWCKTGCSLSLLLFILAIEPLAEVVQLHPDVMGIEAMRYDHKMCLFVDDTLLIITSQLISSPNIMPL